MSEGRISVSMPINYACGFLSEQGRRNLVRTVLSERARLQPLTRARLLEAIRRSVKLEGFRNAAMAPEPKLVQMATTILGGSGEECAAAFLTAWCELRKPLAERLQRFLAEAKVVGRLPARLGGQVRMVVSLDEMERLGQAALGEIDPDSPEGDEIKLMLFLMVEDVESGRPRESDEGAEEGSMTPKDINLDSLWREILERVAAVPVNAPAWDEFDEFIAALRDIRDSIAKERDLDGLRQRLRQLVDGMDAEAQAVLQFCGHEPPEIDIEQLSGDELPSAIEALEHVVALISRVREARMRPVQTLADDTIRNRDLAGLASQLAQQIELLKARGGPAPQPDGVDPVPIDPKPLPFGEPEPPPKREEDPSASPAAAPDPCVTIDEDVGHVDRAGRPDATVLDKPSPSPVINREEDESPDDQLPTPAPDIAEEEGSPIASLSDAELREAVEKAVAGPAAPQTLIALWEQQRRWLLKGQNLRAYAAARAIETLNSAQSDRPGAVPAWLCWLSVALTDPGASRIDFNVGELIPHLADAGRLPEESQRFLLVWLAVALLGREPDRAIQVAQYVPSGLEDQPWVEGSALHRFCRAYLLSPARRGERPHLSPQESSETIHRRLEEELAAAQRIVHLAHNYQNTYVKRFWMSLVGHGGPVDQLLHQARDGNLPDRLPDPERLASQARGWGKIEARYRSNMLARLGTFLEHLRGAVLLASSGA